MTMKLVYKGSVTASFMGIDTELNPGDEFSVADDLVESFLQRPDIEIAADHSTAEAEDLETPEPEPAVKTKKAAQSEPAAS